MSGGNICRRCVQWDASHQINGLSARCAFWTERARRALDAVGAPSSAMTITIGFDTCAEFERAETDETGERVEP